MILHTALTAVKRSAYVFLALRWVGVGAVAIAVPSLWAFAYENQSVGLPAIVVLVGVLITAIGAFLSSSERTDFERELRKKSDEIAALNRQIAASVTGGDSFCYVQFGSLGVAEPNTAILMQSVEIKVAMPD